MGLDMYAYVAAKSGAQEEYYEELNSNAPATQPRELAYWRKHPNLHGWMERLWESKGSPVTEDEFNDGVMFNGVELELTWEDLKQLESDIHDSLLPETKGFFFGNPSDEYYRDKDLEFIGEARTLVFNGLRVFYNSSW